MRYPFIDLHCHPTLKPYSRSFKKPTMAGKNSADTTLERSIWHKDRANGFRRLLNTATSLTKFTQADFTTFYRGGGRVMLVSIDPMEKSLVLTKDGKPQKWSARLLKNLVIGISQNRIKHLFKLTSYYSDLYATYQYVLQLDAKKVVIDGDEVTYKVVKSYRDVLLSETKTIFIVLTIEGAHAFNTGLGFQGIETNEDEVISHIKKLKSPDWVSIPISVGLVHHFPNDLCGFAQSFKGISALAYDQKCNPQQGLFSLGKKVIDLLLSKENGRRIIIDLKHMNLKSRTQYYSYVTSGKYEKERIPLFVSHGALALQPLPQNFTNEINFYDEEIIAIAKSGGVFGIQLDARRLSKGNKPLRLQKEVKNNSQALFTRSYYVWRQIEGMAWLLYKDLDFAGDAWGIQALGSDFDGIVDPLDGFWTHEHMPRLFDYLEIHAQRFLNDSLSKQLPDYTSLTARGIVEKFAYKNAHQFLRKHF